MKKEPWENTIELIQSLIGDSYEIKRLYTREYGAATIEEKERNWTPEDGKILTLAEKDKISSLTNNTILETGHLFKILETLHNINSPFIVGNNFYYPNGINLSFTDKLEVPTSLNNIIYYGNRKDLLGVVTKEVYNYVLFNNLDINEEDKEYLISKKKIKKICHY